MHCVSDEIAQCSSAVTKPSSWLVYSRYWEIDDKRNNSRKAFETRFESRFDCGYWNEFLKRKIQPRCDLIRVSVEMINAKLFWNAFTMRPRKKPEPWNNGQKLWDVLLLSYLFHEVWLICFRMIHNWNSSNHASLSSIVFKIEYQKPFCATFRYM